MPPRQFPSLASTPARWLLPLTAAAIAVVQLQRALPLPSLSPAPPPSTTPASSSWTRLDNCRLVPHPANDGDSFTISTGGNEWVFRLYFADTPETRQRSQGPDRIADQARYFGGIGTDAVITTGQQARSFTANILSHTPFTIFTRWEHVFDSRRFYAHVSLPKTQGSPSDLAEVLVSAGLARIHTIGADHPLGPSERQQHRHLRSLERKAKAARLGAWHHLPSP